MKEKIKIQKTDALIIVDFQNDFCPGGTLPVPEGDKIGGPINKIMPLFNLITASQDWHPADHCSFKENGGSWPIHCVAETWGAEFHYSLDTRYVDITTRKATEANKETYSGFDGTDLKFILQRGNFKRIFVCGLATDYCVKATVLDGLKEKFEVYVILDAIRAVNVNPGDEEKALKEMKKAGAKLINSKALTK